MSSTKKSKEEIVVELAAKIAQTLEKSLQLTIDSRKEYFETHPQKKPLPTDVDHIISTYANQNFVIAGASNLIPGPLGMLAALPEITLILRNQLQMVYDLAVAHGKQDDINHPHALLGIFASAFGEGAVELASIEGKNLLIKRASIKVVQKLLQWLGSKISQKLLKHLLAKWVPIAGAVVIATWSRQSTLDLGNRAEKMLRYNIKFTDDELHEDDIPS